MNRHKITLLLSSDLKPHSEDEQCDCACAQTFESNFDISTLRIPFISLPELYYQVINNDYWLVFNPKKNADIAVINSSALDILESFRSTRKIKVTDDVEVVNKMIKSGLLSADEMENQGLFDLSSQVLSSWLHITDRCNLRCSYCYLPHVREDMSPETGRAAIDAIFRSAVTNKFQQVKIKYAGGEPLLQYPLILELHSYAQKMAGQLGLALEEIVLSNSTLLTEEIVKTLVSLGMHLMISLDGLGNYHDNHRPYAGGRGSFNDVSSAVDVALAYGLVPNISVTISSRTVKGLPELMHWLLERALPFSLNFYRENELSASHVDMQLDEQKIIDGMKAAFNVIENNLPRRGFLGGIIDRANLSASHTHTCGVGQNYLVFDQNGQIAKCHMHIRKPITNIHVEDPLAVIRADQIGVQNVSVEEKDGCKTCEWKYWCTGGCSLATFRAIGRYDVKSPNCNIYKELYPEALRLEGLRLLKYANDLEIVLQ